MISAVRVVFIVFAVQKNNMASQINVTLLPDVEDAICMLNGESLFLTCLKQLTQQPQEAEKSLGY